MHITNLTITESSTVTTFTAFSKESRLGLKYRFEGSDGQETSGEVSEAILAESVKESVTVGDYSHFKRSASASSHKSEAIKHPEKRCFNKVLSEARGISKRGWVQSLMEFLELLLAITFQARWTVFMENLLCIMESIRLYCHAYGQAAVDPVSSCRVFFSLSKDV